MAERVSCASLVLCLVLAGCGDDAATDAGTDGPTRDGSGRDGSARDSAPPDGPVADGMIPPPVDAPWTGILAPERAVDWRSAGVVGDIPSASWPDCVTPECETLFGGTVTASSIEDALASASAMSVVRIPAGTFTLSEGFTHSENDVVLRGAGASQTILDIEGTVTGGGMGLNRAVNLMSGARGVGSFGDFESADWTAGYGQGADVITLSETTGITAGAVGVGSLIILDQLNDDADGYPAAGDLYVCEDGTPCSNQGGNNYARPDRAQIQVVTVTACSPACPSSGPTEVTISPPLALPNWRASQSPGAYWNSGSPLHGAGIENLTVDFTDGGGSGIFIKDAANCWVSGTRWLKTDPGTSEAYHVFVVQSAHVTIRSNYLYGRPTATMPFPLANYPYTDQEVSDIVVENNIFHHNVGQIVPNDPSSRNVFAYNYVDDGYLGVAGTQLHSGAILMDLFEGNNWESFMGDIIHGPHYLVTLFRNHFDGEEHNRSITNQSAVALHSHNRFFNVVGNVLGADSYTSYESLLDPASAIFVLGWEGNASGGMVASDPDVARTLMRWGNWDSINGAARFEAAEVPSAIPSYPNPVPASMALPASFYLDVAPPFWSTPFGTPPWPAIGPDVSGGDIPGTHTDGHANRIPARLCFDNTTDDPAYASSDPRIKAFDAASCYGG